MHIVLTNDDGYDAPGLAALWEAVCGLGDVEIDIIAPAVGRSGQGHAVSAELRCRPAERSGIGPGIVVEGTPADCVRVACHLPNRPRPDWVIAGVNHGSNLGMDVYYSGTIAAAREAAIIGVPAMAISQLVQPPRPDDWPRTTRQAAAVIAALVRPDQPAPARSDHAVHARTVRAIRAHRPPPGQPAGRIYWNVNLPSQPADKLPPGVQLVPVSTDPLPIAYRHGREDDGSHRLQYAGNYHERSITPGTDVAAAFAGAITISPIQLGSGL